VGACECGKEHSGSKKMRGISRLAENLLASEEGLCSMELFLVRSLLSQVYLSRVHSAVQFLLFVLQV
jgi:hypothetical protein